MKETTYTSPDTNIVYDVELISTYGWSRYEIRLDGKAVQFALTEGQIAHSVKHYEQPGWDGWTTSPRD